MAAADHQLPDAVLFDVDGTLLDTGGAGARSWTWAFEQLVGHPVDIGAYTDAGMTDPVVARKTFEADMGRPPTRREMGRLLHLYLTVLPDNVVGSPGYRVLPGVADLLPRLCGEGVLLGLTSGAVEAAAHIKLGRARLNHYFTFGGYGSDSPDRVKLTERARERAEELAGEPLLPQRVFVVGDTPLDVEAARGAGLVSIAVATHKFGRAALEAAGADHVLDDLTHPFPAVAAG
jgi:phosphoglycolate phosphatase-like HAD superfamily hydrolase